MEDLRQEIEQLHEIACLQKANEESRTTSPACNHRRDPLECIVILIPISDCSILITLNESVVTVVRVSPQTTLHLCLETKLASMFHELLAIWRTMGLHDCRRSLVVDAHHQTSTRQAACFQDALMVVLLWTIKEM